MQAFSETSLRVIASFNPAASALIIRNSTGLSSPVSSSTFTPALLYGQLGKGQLILHLGNPPIVAASYPWIYNMLFLANSRPALLQPSFPANTPDIIPALEQVSVTMNLEVANLYDEELQAVRLLVWPANGVLLTAYPQLLPAACQPQQRRRARRLSQLQWRTGLLALDRRDGRADRAAQQLHRVH